MTDNERTRRHVLVRLYRQFFEERRESERDYNEPVEKIKDSSRDLNMREDTVTSNSKREILLLALKKVG